jgi:hypothetical protein
VDDDAGTAEVALDGGRYGFDLRGIRHVAAISEPTGSSLGRPEQPFEVLMLNSLAYNQKVMPKF